MLQAFLLQGAGGAEQIAASGFHFGSGILDQFDRVMHRGEAEARARDLPIRALAVSTNEKEAFE